jgi:glycosyltransferase involved in cell wall biosynthesis
MGKDERIRALQVHNISNVPAAISRGLNRVGVYSRVLDYRNRYGFENDYDLHLEKYSFPEQVARRFSSMIWAVKNFDVVHLHSASFLPLYLDAPLVKILSLDNVKMVWSHWGADLRFKKTPLLTRLNCAKRFIVPDLKPFAPDVETLPICVDTEEWKPVKKTESGKIRILHAPSNREFKGTKFVIAAVEKLKREGYPVDFKLVEGVPIGVLKRELGKADVVVEQMGWWWYHTFGVEAMSMEKTVVDNLRTDLLEDYPDCPVVNSKPEKLAEKLVELIEDKKLRLKLGKEGRAFARKYHDSLVIGKKLKKTYEEILGR